MFRQSPLPCGYLALTLSLALCLAPVPCLSQDRSTPERLDRLERDLNMLQRQVYRGGPPPATADGGAAVNAEIRMNRIELQMRDLTGRLEEFTNQVEQVKQRVEQINGDIEMRFNGQAGASGAIASAGPPPARARSAGTARNDRADSAYPPAPPVSPDDEPMPPRRKPAGGPAMLMPPGTAVPPPGGMTGDEPTPIFGTLTPPGSMSGQPFGSASDDPPELASAAPSARPAAGGELPSGTAAQQYNYAFGLLKQANYPAAEAALKSFIEQHPKDPMAGSAQYWLGETYYTRNKYMEAAAAFAEGYKRYPKGSKAADALLKLGMSLARADQKQNACVALGQLDRDFPNPGASIKDRAAAEKKRLGC